MLLKQKNDVILIYYRTDGEAKNASRRLLPLAVAEFCRVRGIEEQEVIFEKSGKPVFANGSSYHLSVSHGENLLVFAFGPRLLGVDCEKAEEKRERVASRYFSSSEKEQKFAFVWTGKEAVGKLTGVGLSDALRTEISGDCAKLDGVRYRLDRVLAEEYLITIAQKED